MEFISKPRRAIAPALMVRRKLRKHNNNSDKEGSSSAAGDKRSRSSHGGGLSTLHPEVRLARVLREGGGDLLSIPIMPRNCLQTTAALEVAYS